MTLRGGGGGGPRLNVIMTVIFLKWFGSVPLVGRQVNNYIIFVVNKKNLMVDKIG